MLDKSLEEAVVPYTESVVILVDFVDFSREMVERWSRKFILFIKKIKDSRALRLDQIYEESVLHESNSDGGGGQAAEGVAGI